ncbi:MAG: AI-2E family transporter [Ginsengibacter sp.]
MQSQFDYPYLRKIYLVLFCSIAFGFLIFIGKDILVPIAFSVLLAMLLLPINKKLERKTSRVMAIMISLTIAIIFIVIVVYFFSTQIADFVDDLPTLKRQLNKHLGTIQKYIYREFHLTRREQSEYLEQATSEIQDGKGGYIGKTFITITESLFTLVLLPIYTFLILYYRDMIKKFMIDIFSDTHKPKVQEVITESRLIVQGYMTGLLIEMAVIAAINTAGFFIVGIQYAFFLGLLAAILNLIPYIGMLIASVFCMLVTATTSNDISKIIWVAVVLAVVQFFDNNIIMPKIVSSRVKINALITIFGVLVGGAVAGVSGMFLSIPVIAILKVICDRIDDLKPYGELMGDEITYARRGKLLKRLRAKKKKEITV